MTRKEEIKQYANSVYPKDGLHNSTFIAGAEWAVKTMTDKACQWLQDNANDYFFNGKGTELISDFRKAMEK